MLPTIWRWPMSLTDGPWLSISRQAMVMIHAHARNQGQRSVCSKDTVETDVRTRPSAVPSPLTQSVTRDQKISMRPNRSQNIHWWRKSHCEKTALRTHCRWTPAGVIYIAKSVRVQRDKGSRGQSAVYSAAGCDTLEWFHFGVESVRTAGGRPEGRAKPFGQIVSDDLA